MTAVLIKDIYLITAIISFISFLFLLNKLRSYTYQLIVISLFLISIFNLMGFLMYTDASYAYKAFFIAISNCISFSLSYLFLITAIRYQSMESYMMKKYTLYLAIIPITMIILLLTNPFHQLIWSRVIPSASSPIGVRVFRSWLFPYSQGFIYLYFGVGFLILWSSIKFTFRQHKVAATLFITSSFWMLLSSILQYSQLKSLNSYDFGPVTFYLFAISIYLGLKLVNSRYDQAALWKNLFKGIQAPLLLLDKENNVLGFNPSFSRIFLNNNENLSKTGTLTIAQTLVPKLDEIMHTTEKNLQWKNTKYYLNFLPFQLENPYTVGKLVTFRSEASELSLIEQIDQLNSDLKNIEQENKNLKEEKQTKEHLMKVHNIETRSHLESYLTHSLFRAEREENPLVLAAFQITIHAKDEKTIGPQQKKVINNEILEVIQKLLRKGDLIGFLSLNSYGIVLPNVEIEKVEERVKRIKKSISARDFIIAGRDFKVHLEYSTSAFPDQGKTAQDLIISVMDKLKNN